MFRLCCDITTKYCHLHSSFIIRPPPPPPSLHYYYWLPQYMSWTLLSLSFFLHTFFLCRSQTLLSVFHSIFLSNFTIPHPHRFLGASLRRQQVVSLAGVLTGFWRGLVVEGSCWLHWCSSYRSKPYNFVKILGTFSNTSITSWFLRIFSVE